MSQPTSSFSAIEFQSARDPWQYLVDAGLPDSSVKVADGELQSLYQMLDELDEYHLAFALVVGERDAPELFSHKAANLLSHESLSVRLNAYNLLREVPREAITDELCAAVQSILLSCPERERFSDALSR